MLWKILAYGASYVCLFFCFCDLFFGNLIRKFGALAKLGEMNRSAGGIILHKFESFKLVSVFAIDIL